MLGDLTTCLVLSVVGEAAVTSREQTHLANDNHQVHQQVHLVQQRVEQDALSARYTSNRCISKAMSTDHKLN